jgi:protein CpxP
VSIQATTTSKLIAAALATMLTSFTVLGFAQISSAPSPEVRAQHMAQRADRFATSPAEQQAKHQQRHTERQAALKATLGITAKQEPAWNAFVARTVPQAQRKRRANREGWAKLTTPERLDKMQTRQNERAASMIRRIDATRSFYSTLTPEQQQQFDIHAQNHFQRAGMQKEHRHGSHTPMAPSS